MIVPFSVTDFLDRALAVYGERVGAAWDAADGVRVLIGAF